MPSDGNKSGKASDKTPKSRTGTKAKARTPTQPHLQQENGVVIPVELRQRCLDLFHAAFQPGPEDQKTLQEVKGHLYRRDFTAAFGKQEYLHVYASRWSPSRSLGYFQIFHDLTDNLCFAEESEQGHAHNARSIKAVCLGGGAGAELVALAAWMDSLRGKASQEVDQKLSVTLVDLADWKAVVEKLRDGITNPPALSKYASQAKKDSNRALLEPAKLDLTFQQLDLLENLESSKLDFLAGIDLVTLMFTLNELYSTSLAKTQSLLKLLTSSMRPGAYLLVVDSPGSYSTVTVNATEKKYPMHWLLDHTMLGPPARIEEQRDSEGERWEKVLSDESRWFRIPPELTYSIELENMRYQIHMYKRLGRGLLHE